MNSRLIKLAAALAEMADDLDTTVTITNLSLAFYMLAMAFTPLWWSVSLRGALPSLDIWLTLVQVRFLRVTRTTIHLHLILLALFDFLMCERC